MFLRRRGWKLKIWVFLNAFPYFNITSRQQQLDEDIPLGFVTAHDKAVRPAVSAILGSAFAANKSFKVRRQTPEGLQDKN